MASKRALTESRVEYQKLDALFQILSIEYEELKAKNNSLVQRLADVQKTVSELEVCRCTKVALEEKILRLEGDLIAREALYTQNVELRNELARFRMVNNQLQKQVKCLENEKDDTMRKVQAVEKNPKQKNDSNKDHACCRNVDGLKLPLVSVTYSSVSPFH